MAVMKDWSYCILSSWIRTSALRHKLHYYDVPINISHGLVSHSCLPPLCLPASFIQLGISWNLLDPATILTDTFDPYIIDAFRGMTGGAGAALLLSTLFLWARRKLRNRRRKWSSSSGTSSNNVGGEGRPLRGGSSGGSNRDKSIA